MISPSAFRSTHRYQPKPITTLARKGSGAWNLTFAARSAFLFFPWSPIQLPRSGRTHTDVPIIGRSCNLSVAANPHAGLRSLARPLSSGLCHRLPLTTNFSLIVYSQPSTKYLQTGGCSWLLTSNLYHPAVTLTAKTGHS